MDPQLLLLQTGPMYAALLSLPFIPLYLRRIAPQLEVLTGYLKIIVEHVNTIKGEKLP